jgi:Domain of unknown function (DUF4440)
MILTFLLCAATVVSSGWQTAGGSEGEILKREQQRVDFLTGGKIDEFAAMLTPTATYTHSSGAIDDKETLLKNLRSGQAVYKTMKPQDLQVRFVTPDVALLQGLYDIHVVVGGKPQDVPVRFSIVYVKKNGAWMVESWHSTRRATAG